MADGPLSYLLGNHVSPNRALLEPPPLTTKKRDPFDVPRPDMIDVPFGQAMSEGAAQHIEDYGVEPKTASKLGEVLSGALQVASPIQTVGAMHDAAISKDPMNIWQATQTGLSALNPLGKVENLVNKVNEATELQPPPVAETLAEAVEPPKKITGLKHASKHDFDRFEWSPKTYGTGEGAQIFGHGLYFAENDRVINEHYKPKFSLTRMELDTPEGPIHPSTSSDWASKRLSDALEDNQYDFDKAVSYLRDTKEWYLKRSGYTPDMVKMAEGYDEAIALADKWRRGEGGFRMTQKPAKVYEVELMADPEKFLDWDAPLSEQPWVWEMLPQETKDAIDLYLDMRGDNGMSELLDEYTGKDLYKLLANDYVHETLPEEVGTSSWLTGETTPDRHTSEFLNEKGVHGIKFRDAYSRKDRTAPVTRNYVVFSDKIINIVKKYGIAGALSAGLISQQMADQMREQGMEEGT